MEHIPEFVMSAQLHVLLIDDDRVMRMMLEQQLVAMGCDVTTAENGQEGLGKLLQEDELIDIVLVDREMPKMDGVEFVNKMRSFDNLAQIPVVMISGTDDAGKIQQAADVGVYYYMVKPLQDEDLFDTLRIAATDCQMRRKFRDQLSRFKAPYDFVQSSTFYIKHIHEAETLAMFLGGFYKDSFNVANGLNHLFLNAIEHGNLKLGFEAKSEFQTIEDWRDHIHKMASADENKDKRVEIVLRRNKDGIYCRIADEGEGFDWKSYTTYNASHIFKRNGRGIIRALNQFDQIKYNTAGNVVTAIMRHE